MNSFTLGPIGSCYSRGGSGGAQLGAQCSPYMQACTSQHFNALFETRKSLYPAPCTPSLLDWWSIRWHAGAVLTPGDPRISSHRISQREKTYAILDGCQSTTQTCVGKTKQIHRGYRSRSSLHVLSGVPLHSHKISSRKLVSRKKRATSCRP